MTDKQLQDRHERNKRGHGRKFVTTDEFLIVETPMGFTIYGPAAFSQTIMNNGTIIVNVRL